VQNRTCSVGGCDDPVLSRGWCRKHYMRWWKAQKAPAQPCSVEGCEKDATSRGMCPAHYTRWWRHGDAGVCLARWDGYSKLCEVAECEHKHYAKGLCKRHYRKRFPARNDPWNDRRRANKQKRRALKIAATIGAPVVLSQIRERDRDRCGLCGKRVGEQAWPHPLSPSLDHIVPLSRGGAHDPANVQLAHLSCNIRKGNRGGGEQLMLYG
jgi:5-methylcytosine-specific restriction endonuclease McrA